MIRSPIVTETSVMPTVHNGELLLALEKNSTQWTLAVATPSTDSHWQTQTPGYAWDYVLGSTESNDTVQLRAPAQLTDAVYGTFTISAETVIDGTVVETWTTSGSTIVSSAYAPVTELFIRFLATPDDPNLPQNVPPSNNTRGNAGTKIRTSGGGDPPGGRPR